MIFLLGGPPRVGKSKISSEIRNQYSVSVVSTDTLGAVLENVLSRDEYPDLFVFAKFNELPMAERVELLTRNSKELIECVRKESRIVWKAVEAFIRRENNEGKDVLLEGVSILPELIGRIEDVPYNVVFIGNQGENHKENIKKYAEVNEHDWIRGVSEEYSDAFALFVNRMSVYIEQEAKKFNFEYIEMDKKLFGDVTKEIIQLLGINNR
jgi:2-phosphoglycerate kinase